MFLPGSRAERQENGQCHQRIEPESEALVLHEVKRRQHPHIDVRQAVSRERDIGDDGEYLQRHAPARVRKILQDAADEGVAEKCEKPGVEGLDGPGDHPLLRNRMENAGQIGLESDE